MRHATPDVSVVTATYRREREVVQAITSVLRQDGVRVESIVVDDSPEGSAAHAIAAIDDPRVLYVRRGAHSGGRPAVVRNDGAQLARGKYVCFLDDDDELLPGCLRAMTAALDATPAAGVAVARVVSYGSDPDLLRVNEAWARRAAHIAAQTSGSRRQAAAALLFGESFTSASVIRRAHVEALHGYDPEVPLYEDVEFYTRAIRRFGHVFVDVPMLYRRTGEPSMTNSGRDTTAAVRQGYEIMHRKYKAQYGRLEYSVLWGTARLRRLFADRARPEGIDQ